MVTKTYPKEKEATEKREKGLEPSVGGLQEEPATDKGHRQDPPNKQGGGVEGKK